MNQKLHKPKSKGLIFIICILLVISALCGGMTVFAADGTISYNHGARIDYGSHFTSKMTAAGNTAYCGEPGKIAPEQGTQSYTLLSSGSAYRKALYYLPGGYGFAKYVKDQHFSGWSADDQYVTGHLVISYIHDGYSGGGDAFLGAPDRLKSKAIEVANAIKGQPAPPAAFKAFVFGGGGRQDVYGSWAFEPMGWIELYKKGENTALTEGNSCYSLAGARYGVYQGDRLITTLTTDANGYARSGDIEEGSYTVKEISASTGYALDVKGYGVSVVTDQTVSLNVAEVPQNNPLDLLLAKTDTETDVNSPQGAGSLAGAEFRVKFYGVVSSADPAKEGHKPLRTWVFQTDESGKAYFSEEYLVSGDDFFYQLDGKTICLPLGTVTIEETKAPEGYLLNPQIWVVNITAGGTAETVKTYNAPIVKEQVKRGDLEFVKVADGSLNRLANIPFRITSTTTGESHVIVTDDNGYASTAASWNKHTANTNRGQTSEDGIWFGETEPDNKKGALIYDTYLVEELRCKSNKGYKLLSFEARVYKDSVTVHLGTLTNDAIEIHTTATDKADGDKVVVAEGKIQIVDNVAYKNLTPGNEYRLVGTLMDQKTGKELLIDGEPVKAETAFTAKEKDGSVDVVFSFDGSGLNPQNIVVFEKLFAAKGGLEIASHEDLEDAGQTVEAVKVTEISTPKTGDESKLWLWILFAVLAGLGVAAVLGKKKYKK